MICVSLPVPLTCECGHWLRREREINYDREVYRCINAACANNGREYVAKAIELEPIEEWYARQNKVNA